MVEPIVAKERGLIFLGELLTIGVDVRGVLDLFLGDDHAPASRRIQHSRHGPADRSLAPAFARSSSGDLAGPTTGFGAERSRPRRRTRRPVWPQRSRLARKAGKDPRPVPDNETYGHALGGEGAKSKVRSSYTATLRALRLSDFALGRRPLAGILAERRLLWRLPVGGGCADQTRSRVKSWRKATRQCGANRPPRARSLRHDRDAAHRGRGGDSPGSRQVLGLRAVAKVTYF